MTTSDPALLRYFIRARPGGHPVGLVMQFPHDPGSDWLPCDGRSVSRYAWHELFAVMGHQFSHMKRMKLPWYRALWHLIVGRWPMEVDEEPGHFRLPDMQGRVLARLAE